jgi:hypothetical protein
MTGRQRRRIVADDRAQASAVYRAGIARRNQLAGQRLAKLTRYRQMCRFFGREALLALRANRGGDAALLAQTAAHFGRIAMGETAIQEQPQ